MIICYFLVSCHFISDFVSLSTMEDFEVRTGSLKAEVKLKVTGEVKGKWGGVKVKDG